MPEGRRRDFVIVGALCALCFFWRLGSVGIFDFNEGLYVQAAREMVIRADYVTGRVNGVPFYDKPPLALWGAAVAFLVLGFSEFAARLPVALASSLLTLATFFLGLRHFSRRTGLLAAAFVCLNPIVLGTARQMTMDLHQAWWVTAAMLSMLAALRADPRRQAHWWAAFWASSGLGFMAKSFPGLLPLPIAAVYLLLRARRERRSVWSALLEPRPLLGVVILAAVIAPWHLLAYRNDGSFFYEEYWVLHHLGLFHGTEFSHVQPFWHYVPALIAGFYPWSLLLPTAAISWRQMDRQAPGHETRLMILTWAAVTFVLFSAMKSKLISYLLPMFPAVALIAADGVDRALTSLERARGASPTHQETQPRADRAVHSAVRANLTLRGAVTAIACIQIAAAAFAIRYLTSQAGSATDPEAFALLTAPMLRYAWLAITTLTAGALVAWALVWKRPHSAVVALVATMTTFVFVTWEIGLHAYDHSVGLPLRRAVAGAGRATEDGTPLVIHIGRPRRPSVFYYLPAARFAGPLPSDPKRGFMLEAWESQTVLDYLADHPKAYVLADLAHGRETLKSAIGVREVAHSGRWCLFLVDRRQSEIGAGLEGRSDRDNRGSPAGAIRRGDEDR